MIIFVVIALLVWASMNGYVFWRLSTLAAFVPVWVVWFLAFISGVSFPVSLWLRRILPRLGDFLEVVSVNWLGVLFLLLACFAVVDGVTVGGLFFRDGLGKLRLGAVAVALGLSTIAFVLGSRDPVVRMQEVILPGLPKARDGLRLMFVSDFHLGNQIGRAWIRRLVAQVDASKPDLIAIGGDVVDGDVEKVKPLIPDLSELKAPLGVWAVLGNHDSFEGPEASAKILREAGFRVLLNESAEVVPGLRFAGVEDLGFRRRSGSVEKTVHDVLAGVQRGGEGCVFLSHTPAGLEAAADAGAGLMLCGHTHGGQIWPFNFLVALQFPTIAGSYEIGPMKLLVSRGAGTWGPRMRLWRPGEIWLLTLRAP